MQPRARSAEVREGATAIYRRQREALADPALRTALPPDRLQALSAVTEEDFVRTEITNFSNGYRSNAMAGIAVVGDAASIERLRQIAADEVAVRAARRGRARAVLRARAQGTRPMDAPGQLPSGLALVRDLGDRLLIATALEGLADCAATRGQPLRASTLWSAAAGLREVIGSPLLADDKVAMQSRIASARSAAGEEAFGQAWSNGRKLAVAEAVALALSDSKADAR